MAFFRTLNPKDLSYAELGNLVIIIILLSLRIILNNAPRFQHLKGCILKVVALKVVSQCDPNIDSVRTTVVAYLEGQGDLASGLAMGYYLGSRGY